MPNQLINQPILVWLSQGHFLMHLETTVYLICNDDVLPSSKPNEKRSISLNDTIWKL